MNIKYSSMKTKITKDWAALCPGFKVWKPKHIFRLHGPLIMGVCLDTVHSNHNVYQPYFYFHSLMTPSDGIVLGLCGPLLSGGAYRQVIVARHDTDVRSKAEQFMQQYPLIKSTHLAYSQYVQTVANVFSGKHGPNRGFRPHIYQDIVLLACFCGEIKHAHSELDAFCSDLSHKDDCDYIGGLAKWREGILDQLDQNNLAKIVSKEKAKFKIDGFNDYGIEFDSPVRLFDLLKG